MISIIKIVTHFLRYLLTQVTRIRDNEATHLESSMCLREYYDFMPLYVIAN